MNMKKDKRDNLKTINSTIEKKNFEYNMVRKKVNNNKNLICFI